MAPVPSDVTVPAGTVVRVQMIDSVDSAKNHPGDEFDATVASAVVVGDRVAITQSSNARVRLVDAKSAGHMRGRSELLLELVSLTVNGTPYAVQSGYHELQGASRGKRTAETVGGGAGLGALIGAVAGGGKGAAIGAGIGAAAGGATQAATKGQQVKVPSETKIDFTLRNQLTVALNGRQLSAPVISSSSISTPRGLAITSVSPIRPTGTQTIVITGAGFGQHDPFNGCSDFLRVTDIARSNWNAGFVPLGPACSFYSDPIYVKSWIDDEIVIGGFPSYGGQHIFEIGDVILIEVANTKGTGILDTTKGLVGGNFPPRGPVAKFSVTVTDVN